MPDLFEELSTDHQHDIAVIDPFADQVLVLRHASQVVRMLIGEINPGRQHFCIDPRTQHLREPHERFDRF